MGIIRARLRPGFAGEKTLALGLEANPEGEPVSPNASCTGGRFLGCGRRTTVGSIGERMIAFDILCMPDDKADFALCGAENLFCSAACDSEARGLRVSLGYHVAHKQETHNCLSKT